MSERLCRHLGSLDFTDGSRRDVFEDAAGRQLVGGDDGEPLYGWRMIPRKEADVPIMADGPDCHRRPGRALAAGDTEGGRPAWVGHGRALTSPSLPFGRAGTFPPDRCRI